MVPQLLAGAATLGTAQEARLALALGAGAARFAYVRADDAADCAEGSPPRGTVRDRSLAGTVAAMESVARPPPPCPLMLFPGPAPHAAAVTW